MEFALATFAASALVITIGEEVRRTSLLATLSTAALVTSAVASTAYVFSTLHRDDSAARRLRISRLKE